MKTQHILKLIKATYFSFAIAGILFSSSIYSQKDWSFNSENYLYSQTIVGKVYASGNIANGLHYQLGAFYGDECRGIVKTTGSACTYNMFYLDIFSNSEYGEEISFVLRDMEENEINLINIVVFEKDYNVGSLDLPFLWSDYFLYNSTDFLDYSISPGVGSAEIVVENKTIILNVPEDINLEWLSPYFVIAPGARVYLNQELQISEYSYLNLSNPVIYNVVGIDGLEDEWTVTVNSAQNSEIYQNNPSIKISLQDLYSRKVLVESKEHGTIHIFSIDGKMIYHGSISPQINTINLQKSGTFIIKFMNTDHKVFVEKLLVL